MKSISFLFSLFLVLACNNSEPKLPNDTLSINNNEEVKEPEKLLRHVVLFNFKETATDDIVKNIEQAFADLPKKISEIHAFEWGINNSPEGLDKGLTHCFLVTFQSEAARATYLPHPDHLAFVDLIGPYVEDVTVIDYWTH